MSVLSRLKLVDVKKPRNMPAIVIRRNKLSSKLWEQIQLAKSQLEGTPFVVTKFRSVKDRETGIIKQVEVPKRIKPWWFQSDEGKVCFSVRYGSWTIDLAKGKPSSYLLLILKADLRNRQFECSEPTYSQHCGRA